MARKLLLHRFFSLHVSMLAARVGLILSAEVNPMSGQHLRVLAGEVLHFFAFLFLLYDLLAVFT